MDAATFGLFRDLVYERSGIALADGKEVLVEARVAKRMRALGLHDHRDYYEVVVADPSGDELVRLLDAISTNVTAFYREEDHFSFLSEQLARWLAAGQRRFRLWCAASSTGEEPYTIAITLAEAFTGHAVDARLLATDINTDVLRSAQRGVYAPDRVKPVPAERRARWFVRVETPDGPCAAVRDELKDLVLFRRLNLAHTPYGLKGPLDVVFCRNVMIYFDRDLRQRLVAEAFRLLRPGGILMVGHAESLTGLGDRWRMVRPSVYQKP
jgi:chemotaxis protein methyltransferase CheR